MKTLRLLALAAAFCCVEAGLSVPVAQAQSKTAPVTLTNAILSHGYNGKALGPTTVFKPTDGKIHCTASMNRFASVTAACVWIAVDAGGKKNYAFLQKTLPKQSGRSVHFAASLPRPWPVGKYRVDLFLNGKLVRSAPFTVKA